MTTLRHPTSSSTLVVLLCTLSTALCCQSAATADVLVVTDSHHPVQTVSGAQVIELDRPAHIEAGLSAELPTTPTAAAVVARQRLHEGGAALQHQMTTAYQNVADAWSLGVAKIPAVVVGRRYVVYGEADVARAVAHISTYRSEHP